MADERSGAGGAQPTTGVGQALGLALAAVAGFVDAFAYLALHAFAANMTGATVLLGLSLAGVETARIVPRVAAMAGFLLGAMAVVAVLRLRPGPRLGLGLAALLVTGAACLRGPAQILALAMAMGLQNGTVRRFGAYSANTAFITGDLGRLGKAVANRKGGEAVFLAALWLGYGGGAAVAALIRARHCWPAGWPAVSALGLPAAALAGLACLRGLGGRG